jgi:SNF2 family DNA or RNA helicase
MPKIPGIITDPRRQQIEAFEKLKGLPGGMMAMGMGSGKTLVDIGLIINSKTRYNLVFAPKYVVPVWKSQIEKHSTGYLNVVELGGPETIKERLEILRSEVEANRELSYQTVFVFNYDAVASRRPRKIDPNKKLSGKRLLQDYLLKTVNHDWSVNLDEIHKIKAPGGGTSLFMSQLERRVFKKHGMTGTVFHNTHLDAYAQYRFLDKKCLGTSYQRFKKKYAVLNEWGGVVQIINIDDLITRISPVTYFCDSSHLDLPEEQHIEIKFDLEPSAKKIYNEMEEHLVAEIADGRVTAANGAVKLIRLIQITGGTIVDEFSGEEKTVSKVKAEHLEQLIEDIGPHEPIAVFGFFNGDMNAIMRTALKADRKYEEISGRPESKKFVYDRSYWEGNIAPFDEGRIIGIQTRSGSLGIDCTRTRYGIYYSTGLISPGDFEQSYRRILRPGQLKPVTFYHLLTRGTKDVTVRRAQINKQNVIDALLQKLREKNNVRLHF